ncbi:MAG: orotate phosphoribosyltransferase [Methanomicrobiales archaeon]|nr:orotate phosphoribosyltransferase [Methanomicrobiales archaeon]
MVSDITHLLIEYGAIEFGEFTLASGAKSSYYIDIKTAATRPGLLRAIGGEIAEHFSFDVVAGVAVGAVPIAVATALAADRPFAIIRQKQKEHGKAGAIIGDVAGKSVLLVEDVTTSGGSVIYGIEELEQGATERLRREGVELCPLVRASDILK